MTMLEGMIAVKTNRFPTKEKRGLSWRLFLNRSEEQKEMTWMGGWLLDTITQKKQTAKGQ